jgi:hypothetical protein
MKLFIPVVCIAFFSCTAIAKNKYHIGREFSFHSRNEYLSYFTNKGLFKGEQVLYIDSVSFFRFYMEKIGPDSSVVYLGTYLDDSTWIRKSSFLQDNNSCSGRMQDEIEANLEKSAYPDSVLVSGRKMSRYALKHLDGDSSFIFKNQQGKRTVFLLYAYGFGTYYDHFYKDILKIRKKHPSSVNVYLVCVDPVYRLK